MRTLFTVVLTLLSMVSYLETSAASGRGKALCDFACEAAKREAARRAAEAAANNARKRAAEEAARKALKSRLNSGTSHYAIEAATKASKGLDEAKRAGDHALARKIGAQDYKAKQLAGEKKYQKVQTDNNQRLLKQRQLSVKKQANEKFLDKKRLQKKYIAGSIIKKNVNPRNLISSQGRKGTMESRVKRYRKKMKQNGFDYKNPIEVADVNGRLIIVDGHHRTKAAIQAGITKVPVVIRKATKEYGDELMQDVAEAMQW